MDLITLQQAREHLRSDTSDDDADLQLKISAASAAVLDYLGDSAAGFVGPDGAVLAVDGQPVPVPSRVQQATLTMVNYLYRERDGSNLHGAGPNYLPAGVTMLLYSMRKPTAV